MRFYLLLAAVALLIAALSLLIPSTPSYDPWAWLVWGSEIVHLDLHTTGGPSWKPLPDDVHDRVRRVRQSPARPVADHRARGRGDGGRDGVQDRLAADARPRRAGPRTDAGPTAGWG